MYPTYIYIWRKKEITPKRILTWSISKISICLGAEIHFNPNANCTPPNGCQFLDPNTWINGTVPSGDTDVVFVITPGPLENYLLILSDNWKWGFSMFSLVIKNATVMFSNDSISVKGKKRPFHRNTWLEWLILFIYFCRKFHSNRSPRSYFRWFIFFSTEFC